MVEMSGMAAIENGIIDCLQSIGVVHVAFYAGGAWQARFWSFSTWPNLSPSGFTHGSGIEAENTHVQ